MGVRMQRQTTKRAGFVWYLVDLGERRPHKRGTWQRRHAACARQCSSISATPYAASLRAPHSHAVKCGIRKRKIARRTHVLGWGE